jgi:hypothetical protein
MSFFVENDDDYIDNLNSFVIDESSIDKTSFDFLNIKNKRSRCYVYEKIKRDIFLTWWTTTNWTKTHTADQDEKKKKHMYWESDKKSSMWKHFDETATIEDDISKIVCKRCEFVLEHSFTESDINIAKSHLNSKQCFKIAKTESLSQLTLMRNWKKIVNRFDLLFAFRLLKRLLEILFLKFWFHVSLSFLDY